MKMRLGVVLLLACGLVDALKYRDEQQRASADPPAEKQNGSSTAGNETAPPALEGPAHEDNLQDEIVDQADPEFDKLAGGDGCISLEEFKKPIEMMLAMGNMMFPRDLSEEEKKIQQETVDDMMADAEMMYKYADSLDKEDGCLTKAELKKAQELEGPPPGFQRAKEDLYHRRYGTDKDDEEECRKFEEEFEKEMEHQEELEFDAMDRNGDHQISKPEVYHYASENMPEADVDQTHLDDMFNSADTDKNGFVSFEEFKKAGQQIEGDGNEMQHAPPMEAPPMADEPSTADASMFLKIRDFRIKQKRVVAEKMLASKPESAFIARVLSWNNDASTRPHRKGACAK